MSVALEHRAPGDPELTFVAFKCAYAMDVLSGVLDGPYNEDDARRYARAALIPAECAERPELQLERAAKALHVPIDELRAYRCAERKTSQALKSQRR